MWLLTLGRMSEVFKAGTTASALEFYIGRATFEIDKMLEIEVSVKHNIGESCVT